MAEGYLSKRLKEMGLEDIMVISAGTHAPQGLPPTDEAIEVMKENGVDISGYTATILNRMHIDNADLILVMSPHHRESVLNLSPDTGDKIHLLRKFAEEGLIKKDEISDPIGKSLEVYKKCFEIIKNSIEGFLKWLEE